MPVAVAICSVVALGVVPLLGLSVWARARFARGLPSFRCRVGPTWRLRRARWRLLRARAAWAGDVLLVRSGPLHLGVTTLAVGVATEVRIRQLEAGEVRGLGDRPAALRFTTDDGGALEIAVAGARVGQLVGPFLTVLLPHLPPSPRDQDA